MPDPVIVRCQSCAQEYRVDPGLVGRQARCSRCNAEFTVTPSSDLDEDTIMSWINGEDEGAHDSVQTAPAPEPPVWTEPRSEARPSPKPESEPTTGTAGRASQTVRLKKIDAGGAHFEFPASALSDAELRSAFPRRCIGCTSEKDLRVHLIYWPERMAPEDRDLWKGHVDRVVTEVDAISHYSAVELLKHLSRPKHVAEPFDSPFPVFTCEYCSVSSELETHVLGQGDDATCYLRIAALHAAVPFFESVGARGSKAYQALVEQRDLSRDAWRDLDPRIRHRLFTWYQPQVGERFIQFFPDSEFVDEPGTAGLVLTDRRLVFKLNTEFETYLLNLDARMELLRKGDLGIAHIYQASRHPAVVKLDPEMVEALTQCLDELRCRWAILT